MGFLLETAYVDMVVREQGATQNVKRFSANVVRESRDAAEKGGSAFSTLMFGRMGSDMKGIENIAARSIGGIGKMFLKGGLLGVGLMEGIHGIKAFAEELFSGGEAVKRTAEEVSKLRGEMARLAYESTMAGESVAEMADRQAKLLSGQLSGESPLEKLAGKQLTPRIKKQIEDILKLQDDATKKSYERQEKLEGKPGSTEKEKRDLYNARVAEKLERIERDPVRYRGDLAGITDRQAGQEAERAKGDRTWFDNLIGTDVRWNENVPTARRANARKSLLARRMADDDVSHEQAIRSGVAGNRKTLTDVIEKLPEGKQGRQQLMGVEDFGRKILELGGGEKSGASEELQKQTLAKLSEIADSLKGNLGERGAGAVAQ